MSVSKHQILASLANIERQAPLYFSDMPVADDAMREIFAAAMATLSDSPQFKHATPHAREVSLLATLTHVLLESADLRHRVGDSAQAATHEAAQLLARMTTH